MGKYTLKKSTFFDFLNRYTDNDYEAFLAQSKEDVDYINWHNYCLPMTYGDELAEYNAVRHSCALFDTSPIKKYTFSDADAGAFLDRLMTRQMSRQKPKRVIYATFCNENGMLLDDGLLYKFSEDNYLLMISEINHDEHFLKTSVGFDNLKIEEATSSLSGLAVQGPKSCSVLDRMGFTTIKHLKPFEMNNYDFADSQITVARVGFTADLGYELWFEPRLNKAVEQAINRAEAALDIQIAGYGLKALNALRLEGGFIVPGWETAQTFENVEHERTPAELGISWTVGLNRVDDFIGKASLLKEKENGPRFKTIGLAIDEKCEPADGTEVFSIIDGKTHQVGTLPSVAWSHGLHCWLTLASIQSDYLGNEMKYHIEIGGGQISCRMVNLPFVKFDRYHQTPVTV